MIGVYKIENTITGKCYYGSSIYLRKRFNNHKTKLRNQKHDNKELQSEWNLYGENVFSFEIIEYCDKSILLEKENILINGGTLMYNIIKKANAKYGKEHPMYGKKHKESTIKTLKHKRSCQTVTHTEETKNKISKSNKGRYVSKEHIKKMVDARTGKVWNKGLNTGIEPINKIKINPDQIIQKYDSGNSIEEIRRHLNVSWDVVKRILKENNVIIRTIKQQKLITYARKRNN